VPSAELLREAERQMVVCNACRYCEGYCAVFPAMELRTTFGKDDLLHLANLCFDCRDCYYACPFAPPHQFAIDVPKVFAELRSATYREYTGPALVGRLLRSSWVVPLGLAVLAFALALALQGPGVLFAPSPSFYAVVPFLVMVLPAGALLVYSAAVLAAGSARFWRETGASVDLEAFARATKDALGLTYLGGGGAGCAYPGEVYGHARRWLHHLVFWGFLLDLASTTVAAIYNDFLGWVAPYPLLSVPVVLGTVGGVMLVVGCVGLLGLKARSDRAPADRAMLAMDSAFLGLLLATSVTGLLLLAFRDTWAMGTLLTVHLGLVAGLFLTLPYGKFAHVVFRYAALVRHAVEEARAG
jgi:citrate/tricarballylate utilization protein